MPQGTPSCCSNTKYDSYITAAAAVQRDGGEGSLNLEAISKVVSETIFGPKRYFLKARRQTSTCMNNYLSCPSHHVQHLFWLPNGSLILQATPFIDEVCKANHSLGVSSYIQLYVALYIFLYISHKEKIIPSYTFSFGL